MKLNFPAKLRKPVLIQLIIYFVLITAITLASSSYFTYIYFSSSFRSEITRMNQKVLNQLSVFSDEFILKSINELALNLVMNKSVNRDIDSFFSSTAIDSGTLINVNRQLDNLVFEKRDMIDSIMIYSKVTGTLACSKFIKYIDAGTAGKSEEYSWINDFMESGKSLLWMETRNAIVYSDPTKNRGDIITVVCSYPLSATGKGIKGCIAVNIKEQALNDYLVKFNSMNMGQLMIIDNTGAVISHSDKSKLYENISGLPFVEKIINSARPEDFITNFSGKDYVVSFIRSGFNNWFYVSMVPSEFFYQQDYVIKKNVIMISIIILLIVFILSNIFSYKIYVPLKKVIDKFVQGSISAHPGEVVNEYKMLDNLFSNMSSTITDLQETLDKNALLIKHNFLIELLTNHSLDPENIKEQLKFLNMSLKGRHFRVIVFTISGDVARNNQSGSILFFKYKIMDYLRTLVHNGFSFYPVDMNTSTICIIVNSDVTGIESAENFIIDVQNFSFGNFGFYLVAGVGRTYDEITSVSKSYADARISIQYRFVFPERSTFIYEDTPNASAVATALPQDFNDKAGKYLKLEDTGKLEAVLREMTSYVIENNVPLSQIKRGTLALVGQLKQYMSDMNVGLGEISDERSWNKLINPESIYKFNETFLGYARAIYKNLSGKRLNKNSQLVESVKQYITDNLHIEISLKSTAEAFYISSFYLSKIFKEETGYNYINYVVDCKMARAKELLSSTNMDIEKITLQVGYRQTSYFSKKFKEYTGKTPNEYRREMRQVAHD